MCRCDNIGLVSLILLGCEIRVLYHCTMRTRHPDLVSLDFYAIPIFHILENFFSLSFSHSKTPKPRLLRDVWLCEAIGRLSM